MIINRIVVFAHILVIIVRVIVIVRTPDVVGCVALEKDFCKRFTAGKYVGRYVFYGSRNCDPGQLCVARKGKRFNCFQAIR